MSSWEDIKKLAADLHRVQLGESAKKLSDRNCIEVVAKLIADSLIDVVYTLDGKEYVTRDYLTTQIRNETIGNGGRIALTDLQQILNVQFQHIEDRASAIVDVDQSFTLCLGQLITTEYLDRIADEIDERLHDEGGRLSLGQLTKTYDLPTDFLKREILKRVDSSDQRGQRGKIHARADVSKDGQVIFYTDAYVEEQQALVRGALTALTRVMPVSKLLAEINVEAALFFKCFDELAESGEFRGSLVGGKSVDRAVYVPDVYTARTSSYLKDFFYQNGYLEYSTVKKLAITDVEQCLHRLFDESKQKTMVRLQDNVVSLDVWDRIESAVEESVTKRLWADVAAHSTIPATANDLRQMAQMLKKRHQSEWTLCSDTVFYKASELVAICGRSFETAIADKATKEAPNVMKHLRQQQQQTPAQPAKKASKGGKKRGKGGRRAADEDESDTEQGQSQSDVVEFMNVQQLVDALRDNENLKEQYALDSCPEDLLQEIADKVRSTLNMKYRQQLETIFLSSNTTEQGQNTGDGKKSHANFEEAFRRLYQNICLFDADAGSLYNENTSEQLRVHLLRTLCTELTNLAVCFYSRNANIQNAEQMSSKVRDATIDDMPGVAREAFKKLVTSLNAKELSLFYDAIDAISAPEVCSLKQIRTPDKRVRSTICEKYRQELERQLTECESDPAAGLLLACLLLLARSTDQAMVHASGKFVPHLITCLKEKTTAEILALLCETQNAVVQQLKNKDDPSMADRALEKFQQLKEAILRKEGEPVE